MKQYEALYDETVCPDRKRRRGYAEGHRGGDPFKHCTDDPGLAAVRVYGRLPERNGRRTVGILPAFCRSLSGADFSPELLAVQRDFLLHLCGIRQAADLAGRKAPPAAAVVLRQKRPGRSDKHDHGGCRNAGTRFFPSDSAVLREPDFHIADLCRPVLLQVGNGPRGSVARSGCHLHCGRVPKSAGAFHSSAVSLQSEAERRRAGIHRNLAGSEELQRRGQLSGRAGRPNR